MSERYKDEIWLREQYLTNRLSSRQIGQIGGCSGTTVRNWLAKFNIPRRDDSESHVGMHHSPESRARQSKAQKLLWANPEYKAQVLERRDPEKRYRECRAASKDCQLLEFIENNPGTTVRDIINAHSTQSRDIIYMRLHNLLALDLIHFKTPPRNSHNVRGINEKRLAARVFRNEEMTDWEKALKHYKKRRGCKVGERD